MLALPSPPTIPLTVLWLAGPWIACKLQQCLNVRVAMASRRAGGGGRHVFGCRDQICTQRYMFISKIIKLSCSTARIQLFTRTCQSIRMPDRSTLAAFVGHAQIVTNL